MADQDSPLPSPETFDPRALHADLEPSSFGWQRSAEPAVAFFRDEPLFPIDVER